MTRIYHSPDLQSLLNSQPHVIYNEKCENLCSMSGF
jgi:hypothetical protein